MQTHIIQNMLGGGSFGERVGVSPTISCTSPPAAAASTTTTRTSLSTPPPLMLTSDAWTVATLPDQLTKALKQRNWTSAQRQQLHKVMEAAQRLRSSLVSSRGGEGGGETTRKSSRTKDDALTLEKTIVLRGVLRSDLALPQRAPVVRLAQLLEHHRIPTSTAARIATEAEDGGLGLMRVLEDISMKQRHHSMKSNSPPLTPTGVDPSVEAKAVSAVTITTTSTAVQGSHRAGGGGVIVRWDDSDDGGGLNVLDVDGLGSLSHALGIPWTDEKHGGTAAADGAERRAQRRVSPTQSPVHGNSKPKEFNKVGSMVHYLDEHETWDRRSPIRDSVLAADVESRGSSPCDPEETRKDTAMIGGGLLSTMSMLTCGPTSPTHRSSPPKAFHANFSQQVSREEVVDRQKQLVEVLSRPRRRNQQQHGQDGDTHCRNGALFRQKNMIAEMEALITKEKERLLHPSTSTATSVQVGLPTKAQDKSRVGTIAEHEATLSSLQHHDRLHLPFRHAQVTPMEKKRQAIELAASEELASLLENRVRLQNRLEARHLLPGGNRRLAAGVVANVGASSPSISRTYASVPVSERLRCQNAWKDNPEYWFLEEEQLRREAEEERLKRELNPQSGSGTPFSPHRTKSFLARQASPLHPLLDVDDVDWTVSGPVEKSDTERRCAAIDKMKRALELRLVDIRSRRQQQHTHPQQLMAPPTATNEMVNTSQHKRFPKQHRVSPERAVHRGGAGGGGGETCSAATQRSCCDQYVEECRQKAEQQAEIFSAARHVSIPVFMNMKAFA